MVRCDAPIDHQHFAPGGSHYPWVFLVVAEVVVAEAQLARKLARAHHGSVRERLACWRVMMQDYRRLDVGTRTKCCLQETAGFLQLQGDAGDSDLTDLEAIRRDQ